MNELIETKNFSPLKYRGRGFNHEKFSYHYEEWDESLSKWKHKWIEEYLDGTKRNFFEFDNFRTNGVFMILDCLDATNRERASDIHKHLNIHCNQYIDKYLPVEPHWEDNDWINPIFRNGGFGEKFGANIDNPSHDFVFQDSHVIYDGRPNFYISYTNLVDLNEKITDVSGFVNAVAGYKVSDELEDLYIKQNPHFCARTLGELFKLIIDWDLAYHYFNNRENIAILCHKIIGSIDMPLDIYDALKNQMPDSVVAKYIKNNTNATDMGGRPKTPDIVIEWFKYKYWSLRHTVDDSRPNTNNIVDNHYYKRDIF